MGAVDERQILRHGGARGIRNLIAAFDVLEFLLGSLELRQRKVGAGDLGTRKCVVGPHREHTLESKYRLAGLAAIERGDAEQIVEFGVTGTLIAEWRQQGIGAARLATRQQLTGLVGHLIGGRAAAQREQHQENIHSLMGTHGIPCP